MIDHDDPPPGADDWEPPEWECGQCGSVHCRRDRCDHEPPEKEWPETHLMTRDRSSSGLFLVACGKPEMSTFGVLTTCTFPWDTTCEACRASEYFKLRAKQLEGES